MWQFHQFQIFFFSPLLTFHRHGQMTLNITHLEFVMKNWEKQGTQFDKKQTAYLQLACFWRRRESATEEVLFSFYTL